MPFTRSNVPSAGTTWIGIVEGAGLSGG